VRKTAGRENIFTVTLGAVHQQKTKQSKPMKIIPPLLTVMLSVACVLTGCQSPKAQSPDGGVAARSTRNNCYSLLHQLLDDQKGVGLLRFIKREQEDVKNLVKKIAAASGAGAKLLRNLPDRILRSI